MSDLVRRGEPLYEVDAAALARAEPDLVITQQLCEVCAVSLDDVQAAIATLPTAPRVISLDPHGVDDVLADVARVGRAAGVADRADAVAADARERLARVRDAVADAGPLPRVVCVEWLAPLIVAGHWVPEMVSLAGGIDGLAEPGGPSRRLEFAELAAYDPDVVILMPCGMDADRAAAEFARLPGREQWEVAIRVEGRRHPRRRFRQPLQQKRPPHNRRHRVAGRHTPPRRHPRAAIRCLPKNPFPLDGLTGVGVLQFIPSLLMGEEPAPYSIRG